MWKSEEAGPYIRHLTFVPESKTVAARSYPRHAALGNFQSVAKRRWDAQLVSCGRRGPQSSRTPAAETTEREDVETARQKSLPRTWPSITRVSYYLREKRSYASNPQKLGRFLRTRLCFTHRASSFELFMPSPPTIIIILYEIITRYKYIYIYYTRVVTYGRWGRRFWYDNSYARGWLRHTRPVSRFFILPFSDFPASNDAVRVIERRARFGRDSRISRAFPRTRRGSDASCVRERRTSNELVSRTFPRNASGLGIATRYIDRIDVSNINCDVLLSTVG